MNNAQQDARSHVVPKWLEYSQAIKKGDLTITRRNAFEPNKATKECLQNDLLEFYETPTSELACRLMGAGIVIGDKQLARDMATFLQKKGGVDSLSLKLADRVLDESDSYPVLAIDERITTLRQWVSKYPKSPVSWIELSRAFTIKGKDFKAERAALVALQLAPYDRYIVRCAVRLFLHLGKFELAHYYIKRAVKQHFDPWLKATEINVALIAQQQTPEFKRFIPHDPTLNELFHYSELIESAAYLELTSGNEKRAKKQFRLAWRNPSDNVITHAEWLLRNKIPSLRG
ncbi:MAG: hypothetical protein OEV28_06380, partial [Nitrospirota bacterium]|nr:hypothetical protein [Nitrospirota bacterium]